MYDGQMMHRAQELIVVHRWSAYRVAYLLAAQPGAAAGGSAAAARRGENLGMVNSWLLRFSKRCVLCVCVCTCSPSPSTRTQPVAVQRWLPAPWQTTLGAKTLVRTGPPVPPRASEMPSAEGSSRLAWAASLGVPMRSRKRS